MADANPQKKRKRGSRGGKRRRSQNSTTVTRSGQGGRQDQGIRYNTSGDPRNHPLYGSIFTQAREWAKLYYTEWTARKMVDIPVDDMMRPGWTYSKLDEDQQKAIKKTEKKLGFRRALRQALKLERLLGGSAILLSVRSDNEDTEAPLAIDRIGVGDVIATNVIPRTNISAYEYDYDPFSPTFGKPMTYTIFGKQVHKSRMLIFDGDPIVDNELNDLGLVNISREGFGVSVLAAVWDDIIRAAGTRQSAFHLIQRASILLILNEGLKQMKASVTGKGAIAELDELADQLSMYQAGHIDGKNVKIEQWSAQFGSVPQLMEQFLQILSAGSDIPATRFLGQAPGGLNATGESDLENYYNMIDSRREDRLNPQLEKWLHIAGRSTFGGAFDESSIEIELPSLWNMSETDLSTIRTADVNNVVNLVNSGVLTVQEGLQELVDKNVLSITPDMQAIRGELTDDEDPPPFEETLAKLGAL